MSAGQWVNQNLSLGGIIKHTSNTAGSVANLSLQGLGVVAETTAEAFGSPHSKTIGNALKTTGGVVDVALTKTGEGAGFVADKATEYASVAGGNAAALGAEIVGAKPETVATAKKVGTVIGAAAVRATVGVGIVEAAVAFVGVEIAKAAVAMAATSGTTGAAATSSGLAAIGGGSLASGGGMAAGQAVTQGIVATTSFAGAVGQKITEDNAKDDQQSLE